MTVQSGIKIFAMIASSGSMLIHAVRKITEKYKTKIEKNNQTQNIRLLKNWKNIVITLARKAAQALILDIQLNSSFLWHPHNSN